MADIKTCPECAEEVKAAAKVCRFCGHKFKPPSVLESVVQEAAKAAVDAAEKSTKSSVKQEASPVSIGCAFFVLVAFLLVAASLLSSDDEPSELTQKSQQDMQKGFHCLSEWDGSNESTVTQTKKVLRDPDSFEHVETRISPLDDASGEHGLWMTYRARNGFGGMNTSQIYARIDHDSCAATLQENGSGS